MKKTIENNLPIIKISDLELIFDNRVIFNKINYVFSKGIYLIKGRSGIGKSTLLNVISGYYLNYKGEIKYNKEFSIGYCLQEDMFFSNLSVKENCLIKASAISNKLSKEILLEDVMHTLKMFNIAHLIENRVSSLSGGERQRLKLAMLMLDEADVILLDEPTSNLDKNNQEKLISEIVNVWKDKILIIVSHEKLSFNCPITEIEINGEGKLNEI